MGNRKEMCNGDRDTRKYNVMNNHNILRPSPYGGCSNSDLETTRIVAALGNDIDPSPLDGLTPPFRSHTSWR